MIDYQQDFNLSSIFKDFTPFNNILFIIYILFLQFQENIRQHFRIELVRFKLNPKNIS